MRFFVHALVVSALVLLSTEFVFAEYYRYIDENGVVSFTDDFSQVPKNQWEDIKTVYEFKTDAGPSEIKTTTLSTTKTAPAPQQSLAEQRQDLQKQKQQLDSEYDILSFERDELVRQGRQEMTQEELDAYNQRALDLNERLRTYEEAKKAYAEKIEAFNSRLD